VRIDAPRGDRSVVAAGRRYLLRLRLPRPAAVTVGAGASWRAPAAMPACRAGGWTTRTSSIYVRYIRAPAIEPLGVVAALGDRYLEFVEFLGIGPAVLAWLKEDREACP
jgi:hypothetical protein